MRQTTGPPGRFEFLRSDGTTLAAEPTRPERNRHRQTVARDDVDVLS